MNKRWLLLGCALVLCACATDKDSEITKGTGKITNESGEITTAKVELQDGKLKEVSIDETAKGKDKTKKELGDEYKLKEASPIKKGWSEQVAYFENYVEKNGIDKIKLNEEGKPENDDVKSGCTIAVDGFIKAIKEAKSNAK